MMQPILVTSYTDPDLDGTACAIAYAEFLNKGGKKAVAGILGHMHSEAEYVLQKSQAPAPLMLTHAHDYESIVIVDNSNVSMYEGTLDAKSVIEVIDHRDVSYPEQFQNARIQIENVGAAATLVAERFMHGDVAISTSSALLLYGAIASNTLNFQATRTSNRDREAFAWLKGMSGASDAFVHEMFLAKSDVHGDRLKKDLRGDYNWSTFNGSVVVIAQLEIIGAKALARERASEIIVELRQMKRERKGTYTFLNIMDLEEKGNVFLTEEKETQDLLLRVFNVAFHGCFAWHPGLLLRKEMIPEIKKELEK